MSTDLSALMRDLADSVPYTGDDIALADRSYAEGRRRRRVRHFEISSAAAVVVLTALFAGLFLGSAPLAARYGTSGGSSVHGYPKHIGRQWPVLDLPARPGPLAALLPVDGGWEAVSSNGHRWRVPYLNTMNPGLSPDGRLLGYLKGGDAGPFVIRDLVTGRTVSNAAVGFSTGAGGSKYQIYFEEPLRFSADDRYLAFQGLVDDVNAVVVLDVTQARVVAAVRGRDSLAGWSGDDLVLVSDGTISVRSRDHGFTTSATAPAAGLAGAGNPLQVSTDGRQLGVLTGGDEAERLTLYDVVTGRKISSMGVPAKPDNASYALCVGGATYPHFRPLSDHLDLVRVSSTGAATIIGIEPEVDQAYVVLAAEAFNGRPASPLALDRAAGWLLHGQVWAWISGLLLVGLAGRTCGRWARRRRVPRSPLTFGFEPTAFRQPWGRRRKVAVSGAVVVPVVLLLGALWAEVFAPFTAPSLRSTQPLIWWSTGDAAQAKAAGFEGVPATQIVNGGGLHGWLILIDNPTDGDVVIRGNQENGLFGAPDAQRVGLAVATTAGTADQARSLPYRASARIPAHQGRWVRVIVHFCVNSAGYFGLGSVGLEVRAGWVSRNEEVVTTPMIKMIGPAEPTAGSSCAS